MKRLVFTLALVRLNLAGNTRPKIHANPEPAQQSPWLAASRSGEIVDGPSWRAHPLVELCLGQARRKHVDARFVMYCAAKQRRSQRIATEAGS
jgi:hypothetical protein